MLGVGRPSWPPERFRFLVRLWAFAGEAGSPRRSQRSTYVFAVLRRSRRVQDRRGRTRRPRHQGAVRRTAARNRRHPGGPRRAGAVPDRVGQDPGVRRADRRSHPRRGPSPGRTGARAHARARRSRSWTSSSAVANARALSVAVVHGGVGLQRQAKLAARAHIVVATPGRLEDLLQRGDITARPRAGARARRGRPDARHGLQARGRPDRGEGPRQTRRRCSSRRRFRGRWVARPRRTRTTPSVTCTRPSPTVPPPCSIASYTSPMTPSSEPSCGSSATTAAGARSCSSAPSEARIGWSSASRAQNVTAVAMHGNKSQSQRQKALASFEARPCRHPRGHRRGSARDRRARRDARDQLRRPRGSRRLRPPGRPHRPGGPRRAPA